MKDTPSYFRLRNLGLTLLITVVYVLLAKGGSMIAFKNAEYTPVWVLTGLSFSVLLLVGRKTFPGIILGSFITYLNAFLVNKGANIGTALLVSVLITVGNYLELIIGYQILKKFTDKSMMFEKVKSVFEFSFCSIIMCITGATAGAIATCLSGFVSWNFFWNTWFTWCLGNMAGVLALTPLILTLVKYLVKKRWPNIKLETVIVFLLIFIVGGIVFTSGLNMDVSFIKPYWMLPPLLWVVFRFKQMETVLAIALVSSIALFETMNGHGPFITGSYSQSLLSAQIYVFVISVSILVMRAAINERELSEIQLQEAHKQMLTIAESRTETLDDYQKRIDNIFTAILNFTLLDFSKRAPVSDKGDEIDAIAAGLNTLSEEIKFRIQKLQEAEERFRLLIENIKDYAIFMISPTGVIESWNKGAEHIKGYTADEAIGKHISMFYTKEELERNEPEINLKNARILGHYESEGWRLRKDGTRFFADVIFTALYDENKNLKGFVKVTRDITEAKFSEEQLRQNEQQMHAIIENAPDAVIVMDSESNVIRWNPKAEEIFGWSAEEIIGKHLYEFIIPLKYRDAHVNGIKRFLASGEGPVLNKTIEIEALNKNGNEFSVSLSISSPIKVNESFIFIGFIKDITERKHAEAQLKNSENFLDSVVENLPSMLFVKDAKTLKFVKFNKAAEDLLGYSRNDIIGKSDYDFFPKEQADFFVEKDKAVLESGMLQDISEEMVNTKSKGVRTLETKKIPIFDDSGKPKYLLGISNDITDRKKTETELKTKSEELVRSNAELEQFAYVASHDLQEPLRMVTSYVQLLEKRYKDKLDQDANEFIAFAVDGSNRMRTLIQSLLEYSRVNKLKPFAEMDVNNVLEVVLHDLRDVISANNATINIEPLPKIVGDNILIGQLFQNLISNAIKFKGTEPPVINISAKKEEDGFLFKVQDNGIGIESEYSKKIFVIFQRLHTKDKYPGTGIGLAICKKIVERHGGEIWMESSIGKGSTFYFTIKNNIAHVE
jgi:PAS domain S-box-containing protein